MPLGKVNQLKPAAPSKPTSMGCNTCTPARDAMTPVIAGKIDPPTWPRTKINAMVVSKGTRVFLILGSAHRFQTIELQGKLSATQRVYPGHSITVKEINLRREKQATHTDAKNGPEKKPSRLTATASAMIFGALLQTS